MENEVYERDYRSEWEEQQSMAMREDIDRVHELIMKSGILTEIGNYYASQPKIINESRKENYEYLLKKLDALAKSMGGKIRGEVSYTKWEASITVYLPFLEMENERDFLLLKDLSTRCDLMNITATGEREIRIFVFFHYFKDVTDQKEIDEAVEAKIRQVPELVSEFEGQLEKANNDAYVLFSFFRELAIRVEETRDETGQDDKSAFLQLWDELASALGG